jgi:hypothetical protein
MNLQLSVQDAPYRPISERKFVALLKIAYHMVQVTRFTTISLTDGNTLLVEMDNIYTSIWLNKRKSLSYWNVVNVGHSIERAHPHAVYVLDWRKRYTQVYASVREALDVSMRVALDTQAPTRTGLLVTYSNLSYLADNEENAIGALKELRDYHEFMVGQ